MTVTSCGGLAHIRVPILCALAVFATSPALAHASDRGHVLLLPTGYYLVGGAFAVAISFMALALLPQGCLDRVWGRSLQLFTLPDTLRPYISLVSFAGFAVLIAAGFFGSRDPLSNPLPLSVWTLLWVGFVLLQGVAGDLWSWLNPWYGPWRIASWVTGGRTPLRLPVWLGYWPAFILFAAFAWFELIYPAPDDPERLAWTAGLYWLFTFVAMLLFGWPEWSRRGEFLTVFLSLIARFAVLRRDGPNLSLCWPGAKILHVPPLPLSGTAFVLLALSSVSFDGLSKTFFWLGLFGVNPLEYPGRTALMGVGTLGLALTFLLLAGLFQIAIFLGQRLAAPDSAGLVEVAGLLVWSIMPIALAYHAAHYLTLLLVDGQYALAAISDPFGLGWDLFGTAQMQIEAGIVAGADSAWWLWNIQAGVVIAGHLLAVLVAHALAERLHPVASRAVLSQLPLTLLMIAYTVFGLWLLAAPAAG
ncbi:hypothetical protein [Mesorhizobium sp. BE184]|uniref:hypothetical protein n=1 Tax=Mesorhizobium sp. BE184 TaxID=2817714 RepID=UPI00285C6713|nr:hypothetical protein [Mesorhizobium sp. BE184]MDR7033442.1 hypothetical protein [Mesorhizobium sp. BE184]